MVATAKAAPTVQHILKGCGAAAPHPHILKVRQQLLNCRTAANGYHLYQCSADDCRHVAYQYHSCRNRHCPQCGALKKDECLPACQGRDRSAKIGVATDQVLPCSVYTAT